MNRHQRRSAAKQVVQQKSRLSNIVAVHEAGHALALGIIERRVDGIRTFLERHPSEKTMRTSHRGPLLIHAAQNVAGATLVEIARKYGLNASDELAGLCASRGGVLGMVSIVDCVVASASKWFDGPIDGNGRPNYGFVLSDARALPFVAMPGRLGLFEARTSEIRECSGGALASSPRRVPV